MTNSGVAQALTKTWSVLWLLIAAGPGLCGEMFSDDFELYTKPADGVSSGKWFSVGVQKNGVNSIASVADPTGSLTKAYTLTIPANEDGGFMEFRWPGVIPGDNSTGKNHFFVQWREKRSETFDFGADKSIRATGIQANGNVSLDIIIGMNGDGTAGVSPSTRAIIFGQGLGAGKNFALIPFSWDRTKWYRFEWELKLNSPGISDGYTNLWVDGVKIGGAASVNFLGTCAGCTIHRLRMGGWESGGNPAVPPAVRYIDEVKISETYIGDLVSPPSAPDIQVQ
jgi:hypothetical protein